MRHDSGWSLLLFGRHTRSEQRSLGGHARGVGQVGRNFFVVFRI